MIALLLTVTSTGPCQRCAWCHDAPGELTGAHCAGCGIWLHGDCSIEAAGCPSLGCPLRPTRPRLTVTLDSARAPSPPGRLCTSALMCAVFGALACAAAGLVVPAFAELHAEGGVQPSGYAALLERAPAWAWWILGATWLGAWPQKDRWLAPDTARRLDAAAAGLILLAGGGGFVSLSLACNGLIERL